MWAGVQRRLLKDMKSDPAGNTDVSKVLRLPGFLHQKTEPHLVRMVVSGRGRYSVADMVEVYIPIAPPTKPSPNTVKARSATPADLLMVRSALKFLSSVAHPGVKRLPVKHGGGASKSFADHYETWVKFGLAIYRAFADDGFAVWHEWSKSSRAYPGAKECERKWSTFENAGNNGVSLGTVFYHATQNGWRRPHVPFRASMYTKRSSLNLSQKQAA